MSLASSLELEPDWEVEPEWELEPDCEVEPKPDPELEGKGVGLAARRRLCAFGLHGLWDMSAACA